MAIKILLLDIETAPNKAYVWGLFDQNIAINQIETAGYVLCWSAKWLDQKDLIFSSAHHDGEKRMLFKIRKLLDEADAVVHYNGKKFDIPTLNKEFILQGFPPPSPFHQIDLYRVARSNFKFASNRLDYVAKSLGLGNKVAHKGMELWKGCMDGDAESWKVMEAYNRQDVVLLERVYYKMLPWIKNHPNHGLYDKDPTLVCPNCGSKHYQKRGYSYTKSQKYVRFQCQADGCHAWFRSNLAENKRGSSKLIGAA